MSIRPTLAAVLLVALLCTPAESGNALLELECGGQIYVGKSVQHNRDVCWLLAPDGYLHGIPIDGVTSFRKVSDTFRPIALSSLRARLREELGREYEVTNRSEFVVAAQTGSAERYAELLDRVYRSFVRYFSRRSLRLTEPEVPLVVVVYADVDQFAAYCREDNVEYRPTLRGYYQPETNRVALYDPGDELAMDTTADTLLLARDSRSRHLSAFSRRQFGSIRAGLRDTLVHEATHQLAFNTGLHSRVGENPRWVVEGLALIFERQVSANPRETTPADVNERLLWWFKTEAQPNWEPGALKEFVAGDGPFFSDTLNSYSLAWALTYYLSGRRSADFARYLQSIRERDTSNGYAAEDRLSDFQQAFGEDIDWLEVSLLRYIDGLTD